MARELLRFPANASSGLSFLAVGIVALSAGLFDDRKAPLLAFGLTMLVTPALVLWLLRRSVRSLQLVRTVPASAFEEESVEVTLELENRGPLPLFFPEVREIFAPEIHSQKELLYAGRVVPGERVRRSYRGHCLLPRGLHTIGPTAVRVSDPFGWFDQRKIFGSRHPLKIYPRIHRFGIDDPVGRCVAQLVAARTRSSRGDSTDFLTVREYRTGDPPRRIHWGLSAHRGFPVVREFARASRGDLALVLDLSPAALVGLGRNSSLEHAVKITAAVSAAALRRGTRVTTVAGGRPERWLRNTSSAGDLAAVLDVLVEVRPDPSEPELPELLHRARHCLDGRGTVALMVSPYLQGNDDRGRAFEHQIHSWRRNGQRVVAILFDEATFPHLREFQRRPEGISRTRRSATRLAALGIEVHLIPCGADLEAAFAGLTP